SDQDESPVGGVIIGGPFAVIGRAGSDAGVMSFVRAHPSLIAVWHACHLLLTTAAAPVRAECAVRLCPVPHHVIGIRPRAGTRPPAQFPPVQLPSAPGAPCRNRPIPPLNLHDSRRSRSAPHPRQKRVGASHPTERGYAVLATEAEGVRDRMIHPNPAGTMAPAVEPPVEGGARRAD